MSYLARLSLANKSIIALITIAILLFGAFVIPSLKQELYPSLEFPAVSVIAVYPGASPEIVEKDVTNPLEQSIQGIQGIQSVTSYSNEGSSVLLVSYNFGTNLDTASQKLSQQINSIQSTLPTNVTPQVRTFNINSQPIVQLAVTSSQDTPTLATNLKNNIVPVLQGIDGVANVNLTGVRTQIVTVALDLTKAKNQGLSASQIQGALQANNSTLPAGELSSNGQTFSIKVGNTFGSIDDMKNLVVGQHITPSPNCPTTAGTGASAGAGTGQFPGAGAQGGAGQFPGASQTGTGSTGASQQSAACATTSTPVKLSDVATVKQDLAPSTTLTRTNSKDSLGISITKSSSGNTVSISHAIQTQISSLENKLGNGAKITIVSDQAPSITSAVNSLVREALIGAVFAILVILVFLFSIRSTLVTAISIPLSIVIALIGLWVGNYTLNLFTLGGLTIAIGRVVDDSIVVLENIYRHLNNGEEKSVAIPAAVKEVAGAVTASTLTTVAVFLPIAFVGGIVGELFSPFAVTVTVALLASLFVALTIIPVLAYWFLKAPKNVAAKVAQQNGHERVGPLERAYIPMLRWVTGHKAITLIVAFLLFAGSVALIPSLGTNFFSASQQNTFTISQTLPVGTSLSKTNDAARKIETVLSNTKHVQFYQVTVGGGSGFSAIFGSSGTGNVASFSVTTDPNADQNAIQQDVQKNINALTDVGTLKIAVSQGGPSSSGISVNVQASNDTTLRQASQQVLTAVSQVPNTANVSSNLTDAAPLINVQVDPTKASTHGLTASQVGLLVREIYTGTTVTTVTLNGTQENVNLVLGSQATSVNDMQNLLLPAATGNVKLSDVATVTEAKGPTQITHIGGVRTATISADTTTDNTGAVSTAVQKKLGGLHLPGGATYSLGGVTSNQSQAFSGLGYALLAAIVLVYLIMVGTFRSLVQPLILLVSIPFAATGSILLLLATHTQLGVPALIGLLLLIGIVVTNAIVLLDLVHQYRMKGLDAQSAVLEGGSRRLRPILMTAIATILALTPMASGLSQSSGFIAAPLALTVIGGLTTSTLLTLLLVPTLYVLVEGRGGRADKLPVEEERVVPVVREEQPQQAPA